jgi:hypothetical protein
MERYQLRLHEKPLAHLVDEVADRVWLEVAPHARGREVDAYEAVSEAVQYFLALHLRRLDRCGTEVFCDGCVVARPLAVPPRVHAGTDPNLREDADRFQLFVPRGLQRFLYEMASAIWRQLLCEEAVRDPRFSPDRRWQIADALREALAPYVYRNPECGRHAACDQARELHLVRA